MKDIGLTFDNDLMEFDISFVDNDLVMDDGLETCVMISLFSDARASIDDELPNDDSSLRGWWGDTTSEKSNDRIGSKLWLLERQKTTEEVLRRAELYANESLKWLVDEGIATKVVCTASRGGTVGTDRLDLHVAIYYADGKKTAYNYIDIWEGQFN